MLVFMGYQNYNLNKNFNQIYFQIMTESLEYEEEHQLIGEEYKIWKKHVPFLYWSASTYELPTCTQSVEWLDDVSYSDTTENHYCLVGTNSTGNNKIYVLRVELPTDETLCDNSEFKHNAQVGQFGLKQIIIEKEIQTQTEINKVRIKPKSKLIAAKCGNNPNISILDLDNKSNFQEPGIVLEGHSAEGLALEWNPINTNYVASGSSDRKICVWDIQAEPQESGNTKQLVDYIFHSMGVEDVTWNPNNPDMLASCSQDRLIAIWDLRQRKKKPQIQKSAHNSDVFSIKFSPFSQTLLLSGGDDSEIALWDIRHFSKRIHTFSGHLQGVNCLKWSPNNRTTFVSGSSDRSIMMWNIQNAGTENEIMFIHAGHQSRVLDLDINKNNQNTILSSQQCNLLQVWCPSEMALHRKSHQERNKMSEQ